MFDFYTSQKVCKPAVETVYSVAYNVFCNEVIDAQICRNKEVLSKLVDLFRKYIATYEQNQDGSEYRASEEVVEEPPTVAISSIF